MIANLPPCGMAQSPSSVSTSPEWRVYNSSNSGLPENKLKSITMDKSNDIWLGTAGDGGVKFDGSKWYVYNESTSGISNNHVDSIAIDRKGAVWFGTGNGVCMFDGDTTWTIYNTSNSGLPNDDIYPVAIDRSGSSSALFDEETIVWIGTYGDGLVKFDGKKWKVYNTKNSPLIDDLIRSIAIDKDGNKWIGTLFGGLAKFNGDATWDIYTNFNSELPSNAVYPIMFDKDMNVWIGTEGGLAMFSKDKKWTVYKKADSGLPDDKVYTMAFDNEEILWIGTVGGGLARFDPSMNSDSVGAWKVYNTFNSGLPHNEVRGIAIDNNGVKWLATYGGGLAKFDENGKGWENTIYDELDGFDPLTEKSWNIKQLTGMVKKYDIINAEQQKIVCSQLDQYLNIHPSDVGALVLYTQIGIKKNMYIDKLHQYLDKALANEPDNAEANYWKGRLYGIKENVASGVDVEFIFRDYENALKYIKTALSLDPENIEYMETLSLYLAADRRFEEARIFTKIANDGNLPVYQLLKDLQIFPLPPSVIFLPEETKQMTKSIKEKGDLGDFPILRVHVFAVPLSAEGLGEFYEERLPEFKLFEVSKDKKEKTASFKQYLKVWDNEIYTVNSLAEIPGRPSEGITLDVNYIYRKPSTTDPSWISETLKISPSLSERKAFCKITYVNYR